MGRKCTYTKQQIKWLEENVKCKTYSNFDEITNAFNVFFNEHRTKNAIRAKINQDMGLQMGNRREFTKEEKEWIENNYKKYSLEDFVSKYNELFQERSLGVLRSYLAKNKFYMKKYLEEEEEWLRENFFEYETIEELWSIFNKIFGRNRSLPSFFLYCERMGLKKYNPPTQEEIQWIIDNIEVYGYNNLPIKFSEKFNRDISIVLKKIKDLTYIVTQDRRITVGRTSRKEKPLAEAVWENHYGKEVPEDCVMVFLNNNKTDFSISNLYPMKKKYLPYMGRNHWYSDNPEFTLTAIKWCELMYATQE